MRTLAAPNDAFMPLVKCRWIRRLASSRRTRTWPALSARTVTQARPERVMIAPWPTNVDVIDVVVPRTPNENCGCCCGSADWPAGPVPISPLYCIGFGSCRSPGEHTRTPYVPPDVVSYEPFADRTLPLPSRI